MFHAVHSCRDPPQVVGGLQVERPPVAGLVGDRELEFTCLSRPGGAGLRFDGRQADRRERSLQRGLPHPAAAVLSCARHLTVARQTVRICGCMCLYAVCLCMHKQYRCLFQLTVLVHRISSPTANLHLYITEGWCVVSNRGNDYSLEMLFSIWRIQPELSTFPLYVDCPFVQCPHVD